MNTLSFEQLSVATDRVNRLVPGYFIQELDPVRAIKSGQGNCFTAAMIAGAVISHMFDLEASVAWSLKIMLLRSLKTCLDKKLNRIQTWAKQQI